MNVPWSFSDFPRIFRRIYITNNCPATYQVPRNPHNPTTMLSIAALAPAALNFGGFATPKKAAEPAFAYGLPGNFNALGGAELNFDPAGFLKARAHDSHTRTNNMAHANA